MQETLGCNLMHNQMDNAKKTWGIFLSRFPLIKTCISVYCFIFEQMNRFTLYHSIFSSKWRQVIEKLPAVKKRQKFSLWWWLSWHGIKHVMHHKFQCEGRNDNFMLSGQKVTQCIYFNLFHETSRRKVETKKRHEKKKTDRSRLPSSLSFSLSLMKETVTPSGVI